MAEDGTRMGTDSVRATLPCLNAFIFGNLAFLYHVPGSPNRALTGRDRSPIRAKKAIEEQSHARSTEGNLTSYSNSPWIWHQERQRYAFIIQPHRVIWLALEDAMIQLNTKVFGDLLHLRFHLILHATSDAKELLNLTGVEHNIAAEQHELEQHVSAEVDYLVTVAQVRAFNKTARSPVTGDLDAIDRRSKELIVALHNAEITPNEYKLLRPLFLVGQDVLYTFAHLLLHLKGTLSLLFPGKALLDFIRGTIVTAGVWSHECRGGEDISVVNAPFLYNLPNSLIIECHE